MQENLNKGSSSEKVRKGSICDVCNISVGSKKNLAAHQNGRRHENNLKKLMRKSVKNKATVETSSENSSVTPPQQQQCPVTVQLNLDMSNQSNQNYSQSESHKDKHSERRERSKGNHSKQYRYNEHFPHNFRQPYNPEFAHHNNWNFCGRPWQQNYGNNPMWHNNRFPPPYHNNNRFFQRSNFGYNGPCYGDPNMPFEEANTEWAEPKSTESCPANESSVPLNKNSECSEDKVTQKEGKKTGSKSLASAEIPVTKSMTASDKIAANSECSKDKVTQKEGKKTGTKSLASAEIPVTKSMTASDKIAAKVTPVRPYDIPCPDSQDGGCTEKTPILTESMTGKRIAHWINPLNQKDQAEVRQLVTQFSKSRKKENLLKLKQQTESPEKRDEELETMESSVSASDVSNEIRENISSHIRYLDSLTPKTKRRNRTNSDCSLSSTSSSKGRSPRTESSSATSSKKSPGLKTDFGVKKRKSSFDQTPTVKRKYTSSEDLVACINAAAEDRPPKYKECIPALNGKAKNKKNDTLDKETLQYESSDGIRTAMDTPENNAHLLKEPIQQTHAPCIKKEPMDVIDQPQVHDFLGGLNLNELASQQLNPENNPLAGGTMTPVESLIDLFASGNVKVKKEYDDPVIDALSSVDPAIFDKVCSGQFINSTSSKTNVQSPSTCNVPSVTGSLKVILNELQTISAEEEKVKRNLRDADTKIHEFQLLLDEWKTKKMKLQSDEEILRNQRNILVKSMNDLVSQQSMESNTPTMPRSKAAEIDILPVKIKKEKEEIPVIDLDDSETITEEVLITENDQLPAVDGLSENMPNMKNFCAHKEVVNSLQVFEGCLYTCSNDGTAKRFDLKNLKNTVTYQHDQKNVNQLSIAKICSQTIVYTICSASNIISLFKAEDGTLLKNFHLQSNAASICKGKGNIYVGLRSGAIIACNWKDQKEIVNVGEPIRSLVWTQQGGLNVLVTLSTRGAVSVLDADRNGLLIRNVKPVMAVPLLMTVHGDSIYLSGSGLIVVIEISTGRLIRRLELSAPYTSLAVYQSYIFTTAYSGLVRCYAKEKENHKVCYGAGSSLTCIYIHHGWVFTANRYGVVDVFKFNPDSAFPCQFGNCDLVFSKQDDLAIHVLSEKDHDFPTTGSKCPWRSCSAKKLPCSSKESVECHLRMHFDESKSTEGLQLPIYNLSF